MAELTILESGSAWKFLGMRIIRNSEGRIGVHIPNTEGFRQMHGTMHGGLIATVIDSAAGTAVNEAIGNDFTASTVELKVNYLLPATSDLTAYAKVVKKGKNLVVTTIEALDEDQNIVAIGIATFMVKPIERGQLGR